jgi:hypothetical protein
MAGITDGRLLVQGLSVAGTGGSDEMDVDHRSDRLGFNLPKCVRGFTPSSMPPDIARIIQGYGHWVLTMDPKRRLYSVQTNRGLLRTVAKV